MAGLEVSQRYGRKVRLDQLRAERDAAVPAGKRAQSVTNPPSTKIARAEGKALARTNFMSWAIDVTGSAEAAKKHFKSIRPVVKSAASGTATVATEMWLAGTAATRFEKARARFEREHPGYTIPITAVAQSARTAENSSGEGDVRDE
jgi:hypothetical protein